MKLGAFFVGLAVAASGNAAVERSLALDVRFGERETHFRLVTEGAGGKLLLEERGKKVAERALEADDVDYLMEKASALAGQKAEARRCSRKRATLVVHDAAGERKLRICLGGTGDAAAEARALADLVATLVVR